MMQKTTLWLATMGQFVVCNKTVTDADSGVARVPGIEFLVLGIEGEIESENEGKSWYVFDKLSST